MIRAGRALTPATRIRGRSGCAAAGVSTPAAAQAEPVGQAVPSGIKEPYRRDYGRIEAVFTDTCGNLLNLHQD